MISVGERRWRAHQINGAATIQAFVTTPKDTTTVRVMQTRSRALDPGVIENDQRRDVTPLEPPCSISGPNTRPCWRAAT
jgi:ParB-like chromosome segregation protein Spo0J